MIIAREQPGFKLEGIIIALHSFLSLEKWKYLILVPFGIIINNNCWSFFRYTGKGGA